MKVSTSPVFFFYFLAVSSHWPFKFVFLKLLLQTKIQKCSLQIGMENKLHEVQTEIRNNQSYPSFLKHTVRFSSCLSYPEFSINEDILTLAGFTNIKFLHEFKLSRVKLKHICLIPIHNLFLKIKPSTFILELNLFPPKKHKPKTQANKWKTNNKRTPHQHPPVTSDLFSGQVY